MASWYSNLVQKTSSQISSLRQNLLSGDADGDTDDDTHVCRVLRGYYSEKGRPMPAWLPVDPKGPAPTPQPMLVNNPTGGRTPQPAGGLSSLWDNNGPGAAPPPPQSLRAGGGRTPVSLQPGGGDIHRRPLAAGRGSYQGGTASPFGRNEAASVPPGSAGAGGGGGGGAGGSAQERLRQRLWGGSRTTSPSSQSSQGPFQPPAGGGGGNYEDRFAPGGMYDQTSGGGGGGGHTGSDGAADGGRSGGLRRAGLPSGPRGYR
ncbi:hypothetical protein FZEAL_533 [Fusarium zealandicum]|uniref:Mso1 N-terminal domain-containing protein n=1 Tax=Fusarium zealandicum TaxID=1053134 RepID=A0A8H4XPR2_9HYPO|nr:hypothetical protein FZEAL_533 [Fusarium zealandicum]